MRRMIALVLGLLLVAASNTTWAFEEQQMKGDAPAKAERAAPSAPVGLDGKALEFKVPDARPAEGTKIRIPGLGVIGEIPKIDLGLDLLYGATDAKRGEPERNEGNGVMLRGKIPLQPR